MVQYIYLKPTSYFTLIALILVMGLGSIVRGYQKINSPEFGKIKF